MNKVILNVAKSEFDVAPGARFILDASEMTFFWYGSNFYIDQFTYIDGINIKCAIDVFEQFEFSMDSLDIQVCDLEGIYFDIDNVTHFFRTTDDAVAHIKQWYYAINSPGEDDSEDDSE